MLYKSLKVATHYVSVREALGNKDFNLEDEKYTTPISSQYGKNIINNEDKDIEEILNNLFLEAQKELIDGDN